MLSGSTDHLGFSTWVDEDFIGREPCLNHKLVCFLADHISMGGWQHEPSGFWQHACNRSSLVLHT